MNKLGEELLLGLERQPPRDRSRLSRDGERSGELRPHADRLEAVMRRGSGSSGTGEIQHLLLLRLRFLATLLSLAMPVSMIIVVRFWRAGDYIHPGNALNLAVCLVTWGVMTLLAAMVWRRQSLSLRHLRALELILFGALVSFWSWFDIFFYPEMRLPERPFWFGLVMAKAIGIPWVLIIIAYGIFIPNTWRRCAAVVGIMAAAPIAISIITGLTADTSKDRSQEIYLLIIVSYMGWERY
jgi:hypothetical protein